MKKRGFTLIELLIVIAIIGILALIVIINLADSRERANYTRVKSDVNTISKAMMTAVAQGKSFSTALPEDSDRDLAAGMISGIVEVPKPPTGGNWTDNSYHVRWNSDPAEYFAFVATPKGGQCRSKNGNLQAAFEGYCSP
jgi:prepilin-type N-terminal cleavage/methylation domain-containing protein